MSRGRHRHSSLLGRSVPPIATGVLVVGAGGARTVSPDPALVRSLGVAAVLAAVGLGLLLRQRDRAARTAAELAATRRLRAEERFEEQLAEVEYAAEVAEERATRFGRRLTAEKSRLAKAETEIARLLRERAVMVAEQALKEAEATQRALAAARPKFPASPAAYVRAASVLRQLEREAERAEARRESTGRTELAVRPRAEQSVTVPQVTALQVTAAPQLVPAAPKPAPLQESVATRSAAPATARPAVGAAPTRPVLAATAEPLAGAPATAIVPAERQRPRPQAGAGRGSNFSFFGRTGAAGAAVRAAAPAPAVGSVTELGERADLADVLGDEALAESARYAAPAVPAPEVQAPAAEARPTHTRPEVVDLTPHDETEYLELPELRANRG